MKTEELKQCGSVKRWFNMLALQHSGSKRTEEVYVRSLKEFVELHKIADPDLLIDRYNAVKYDLKEREKITDEFVDKIELYAGHLRNRDLAKTTVARKTTAVKSFFVYNKVELDWKPIRANAKYRDRLPTKEELRKLFDYSHMSNRMKAIVSMLIESGLRIGTVLQLRYKSIQKDYERDVVPCRVAVTREQTKGKTHDYYSFIGKNTIDYLRQYFEKRQKGTKTLEPETLTPDSLLFKANMKGKDKPVQKATVANQLKEALFKLDIIKDNGKGHWKEIHPHTLRKYFRTYMNPAGFSWVHFWMGHKLKANDDVYFQAPEVINEARQIYKNAYENLDWTRKPEAKRLNGLQKKVISQSVRIKSLERTLETYKTKSKQDLLSEVYQRDSELSNLKEELHELGKRMQETDEHELKIIKMFDELLKDDPQLLRKFREKVRATKD